MSDQALRTLRKVTGAILSVTALLCAIALIIACVQIYRSADHPFTPERIKDVWKITAIFVWLFVACAIGAGALSLLFPTPSKKLKGHVFPKIRLAKAMTRLSRKRYTDALLAPLEKHRKYLRFMHISAVFVCVISAIYPFFYLNNLDNFTAIDEQLNAQVLRALIPSLCFAAEALGFCLAVRLLSNISCERALIYAKAIMLLPAPAAEKRPMGKQDKGLPEYATIVLRILLLIVAGTMIVIGIFNGSANDVLQKAIRICTECIGLG